jgi:hypothetical protein
METSHISLISDIISDINLDRLRIIMIFIIPDEIEDSDLDDLPDLIDISDEIISYNRNDKSSLIISIKSRYIIRFNIT